MHSLNDALSVAAVSNARFLAGQLFFDSFAQPFPVPRDNAGLAIATPPETWRQYVALYKWSDLHIEPVGFCNWIRYGEVYLEGGLCVRRGFYRRLPRNHWQACNQAGGIAQIMMETAARELNDCSAWFGYVGDKMSSIVTARAGYQKTRYKYLIVKWFKDLPEEQKRALEESIDRIGPF